MSSGHSQEVKNKKNYMPLFITTKSGCRGGRLREVPPIGTGKNVVFWIDGRLWEGVAYERWSHMEA